MDNMSRNTPSPSMKHVACKSKLHSVVRSGKVVAFHAQEIQPRMNVIASNINEITYIHESTRIRGRVFVDADCSGQL